MFFKHAAVAQQVEHILGKDEVSSSNLDSSSRRILRNHAVSEDFLFYYCFEPCAKSTYKRTYALKISNTLPHWKGQGFAPGLFLLSATSCRFQGLPEDVPGPLDAFLVGMGVHSQGSGFVRMAQLFTHWGNVRAVGDGYACKAVPIGYNKDKSEIPRKIKGNRVCLYSFSSKKRAKNTRKTVRQKGWCHIKDNKFRAQTIHFIKRKGIFYG